MAEELTNNEQITAERMILTFRGLFEFCPHFPRFLCSGKSGIEESVWSFKRRTEMKLSVEKPAVILYIIDEQKKDQMIVIIPTAFFFVKSGGN